ncbi:MAG: GAF domain-containing protein [Chitinivibrionales bacterium]|nr:GAF domain-containing protein [Chitinivibrionales bacterium]
MQDVHLKDDIDSPLKPVTCSQILEKMQHIQYALLTSQSIEYCALAAVKHIRALVKCARVSISTFDYQHHIVTMLAVDSPRGSKIHNGDTFTFEDFGAVDQISCRKPFVTDDNTEQESPAKVLQILKAEGIRSTLNVPLMIENRVIGSLNCADSHSAAFSPDMVAIIMTVATPLAITLQQAQLRFTIEMQSQRLRKIREIEHLILGAQSPQTIAKTVVDHIRCLVGCHRASIATFDHELQMVEFLAININGTLADDLGKRVSFQKFGNITHLATGKPEVVADFQTELEEADTLKKVLLHQGLRSSMKIPLIVEQKLIGSLNCADTKADFFDEDKIDMAAEVAVSLSVALQQAIHRQHQAAIEAELSAEKEQLQITLRSIGDGVITTDVQGRIILLNKVAEQLTGWTTQEAAGASFHDIVKLMDELTLEPFVYPLKEIIAGTTLGYATTTATTILLNRDGSRCMVEGSCGVIRDNTDSINGVVVVLHNCTEKWTAQRSMSIAERLESLGLLAGGIAHDFNNLLTGLFGYIEVAREHSPQGGVTEDYLEKALQVFNRAKSLTNQLLIFAKGGAPTKRAIALAPRLAQWVQFGLSGSPIQIQVDIQPDLWLCDVDENQIAQVIDNIVINARQAMPQAGILKVGACNVEPNASLPQQLKGMAAIKISIQDTGIGIPAEHINRIFDPFFTTKQDGSGLGLATAYSIISRHGGCIVVHSTPAEGSVFEIYLPALTNQITEEPREHHPMPHRGHGSILIMDDETYIQNIACIMLTTMGYTVAVARCSSEAVTLVDVAVQKGTPFNAAILDLTIPGGIGGKETVERIKQLDPQLKVIASSGYSHDLVMAHPDRFGFSAVLVKPYRRSELEAVMKKVFS